MAFTPPFCFSEGIACNPQKKVEICGESGEGVLIVSVLALIDPTAPRDKKGVDVQIYRVEDNSLLSQETPYPASAFKSKKKLAGTKLKKIGGGKVEETKSGKVKNGTYVIVPTMKENEGRDFLLRVISSSGGDPGKGWHSGEEDTDD